MFGATASWNIIAAAVYVLADFYSPAVIAFLLFGGLKKEKKKKEKEATKVGPGLIFSPSHLCPSSAFLSYKCS